MPRALGVQLHVKPWSHDRRVYDCAGWGKVTVTLCPHCGRDRGALHDWYCPEWDWHPGTTPF